MGSQDPLELAIRKISETRNLIQLLITSSESFDYPKAKAAVRDLQCKIVELSRLQNDLKEQCQIPVEVIEFPAFQRD
jgi:hypothetical protein